MEQHGVVQENTDALLADFITEDILKDFLAEANEGVQEMEFDFIALEKNPGTTSL